MSPRAPGSPSSRSMSIRPAARCNGGSRERRERCDAALASQVGDGGGQQLGPAQLDARSVGIDARIVLVLLHLGQLREPHHDGLAAQRRELLRGAGAEHVGIAQRSEAARIAVEVEVAHAGAGVQRQQRLHPGAASRRDGVRVRTVEQLDHALRDVGMAAQQIADEQAVRLQRLPVAQRLRLRGQQLGIARARARQQAREIGVGVRQQGMNRERRQARARGVGAAEGREAVDAAEHAGGQREGRRPERRRVDRGAQLGRGGEKILARTRLADVGPRHQIEAARRPERCRQQRSLAPGRDPAPRRRGCRRRTRPRAAGRRCPAPPAAGRRR